jgi:predicted nuclease with RNAse H fold
MTRNKGEQMKLPLKLLSPEKVLVGDGRSLREARRLHLEGRYWLVPPGTPGSKDISSHTLRICGNEGDPVVNVYGWACLGNKSNKREAKVNDGRESESFIVAMKLGNASGAKEGQYGILSRDCVVQTPSWGKP